MDVIIIIKSKNNNNKVLSKCIFCVIVNILVYDLYRVYNKIVGNIIYFVKFLEN